jgi:hypothetical protein
MILTHGANSIGWNETGLLYLTYFNNFDFSTMVDTPIIGEQFRLDTRSAVKYNSSTLQCMGTTIPALYVTCGLTGEYNVSSDISIPEDISIWSIEYLLYIPYESLSSGVGIYFSTTTKALVCDPYGWGSATGSFNGISNIQVYNGAMMIGSGGDGRIRFPIDLYNNICHCAQIINHNSNSVRVYINGTIYCSYIFDSGVEHKARPYLGARNNWSGTMSQLAIFGYDKSINDGMNYPVPTSPYYPIA